MSGLPGVAGGRRKSRGQTMTEYSLIIASVVIGLILLYQQAGSIDSFLLNQVVPLF